MTEKMPGYKGVQGISLVGLAQQGRSPNLRRCGSVSRSLLTGIDEKTGFSARLAGRPKDSLCLTQIEVTQQVETRPRPGRSWTEEAGQWKRDDPKQKKLARGCLRNGPQFRSKSSPGRGTCCQRRHSRTWTRRGDGSPKALSRYCHSGHTRNRVPGLRMGASNESAREGLSVAQ